MSCCCCCGFAIINTSDVGVVEYCGKFSRLAEAGCNCLMPFEYIVGKVTLRVQELTASLETKTKDNVFVVVNVSVQYQTIKEKVYSAFYKLSDPQAQMRAYIYDTIRAAICQTDLDEAFESKDAISLSLKTQLQEVMSTYGITIIQALVIDLSPDAKVQNAMNEINASKRMKESAYQRAEGEKVLKVKRAEAEAEAMYLSGIGVAKQRKAIMDGFKDSILDLSSAVEGTSAKDIMDLLVLNQYFDTIQDMGANKVRCVFLASDDQRTRTSLLEAAAAK